MKPLKNTQNIIENAHVIGHVITPKGNIKIWELIKSCGYKTNFLPKSFKYIELPNGQFFTYAKSVEKHWEKSNFIIKYF